MPPRQVDNHIAELTVRETLDFAARVQGAGFGERSCLGNPVGSDLRSPHYRARVCLMLCAAQPWVHHH